MGEYMRGVIISFNPQKSKRFGFVKPDDGSPDLFFHFNDQRLVVPSQRKGEAPTLVRRNESAKRMPQIRQRIIFKAEARKNGPFAEDWTFEDEWDAACVAPPE
jgi:cold shock CspA family protein